MAGMGSNLNRVMVTLALVLLLVPAQGLAQDDTGFSTGGTYTTSNGATITWSFSSSTVVRHGWIVLRRPGWVGVIEGPDGELVPIEEDDAEGESETAPEEYRVIDFARALMRGALPVDMLRVMTEEAGMTLRTREHYVKAAIGAYGAHLQEHPEDWIAVREMAVALIEANRVDDGIQMMHEAYFKRPELGILPIKPDLLGQSGKKMRKMVVRVVQHTHRDPTAEGWMTVAVLMQSEGRGELGGQILNRAQELGLDKPVLDGLRAAMPSQAE